jgi:hypothetical protein
MMVYITYLIMLNKTYFENQEHSGAAVVFKGDPCEKEEKKEVRFGR